MLNLLVIALLACGTNASDASKPGPPVSDASGLEDSVHADLTTPDRALRSYWRYKDASERVEFARTLEWLKSSEHAAFAAQRAKVMGGDARVASEQVEAQYRPTMYAYEIVDVKPESDSRALVNARIRNVTPLGAGAVLTELQAKQRRDGELFRYTLEKSAPGWQVVQVQYSFGSGEWHNRWDPSRDQFGVLSASTTP